MDIGLRIKYYREKQNISQNDLAFKVFVSRQTISNWETNKSYPDINSLTILSNIFNVSLDDFIRGDLEKMRAQVDKSKIQDFNIMGIIFAVELLIVVVSAYPLVKLFDIIGIIIWVVLFLLTFATAHAIEKFKKSNDIQTYKEIISFIEKKPLTYEEAQQEMGKRIYQKIFIALLVGVVAFIISLIIIFICNKI